MIQTLWNKHVKRIKMCKLVKIVLCFLFVNITWVFFRAPDFGTAFKMVTGMFSSYGMPFIDIPVLLNGLMSLMIVFAKDVYDEIKESKNNTSAMANLATWGGQNIWMQSTVDIAVIICLAMYVLLFGVLDGGQFIYFQF